MKYNQSTHLPGIFDIEPIIKNNHLFYGDNLTIMRSMPSMSVDLIYLDPPFSSQRNYNLIYKKLTGQPVPEQEEAFCDAWEMDAEKEDMVRNMPIAFEEYGADKELIQFWQTWIQALRHTQPRLLAYLVYMSYRLFEMKRLLKPSGSLYLHCDPTASHYIKVIMDGIFGHRNFLNEIIWHYRRWPAKSTYYQTMHDVILFYRKSTDVNRPFNTEYKERAASTQKRWGNQKIKASHDDEGRRQPSIAENTESIGVPLDDVWEIPIIAPSAHERLGYPTQKPIALLERIIKASSNEGDVVFDPFAGCGTAIYAAHLLGRKWIGCDIAILSVQIVRDVLYKRYGLKESEHYQINGVPLSIEGADDLFSRDPRQFQHWAVELAGGFCSMKHAGDLGVDGRIHFETQHGLRNMVLSVKGGKLTPAYVRELRGVYERENDCEMGGFICLQEPTKGMISEAAAAGIYNYRGTDYHRLQVRTVEDLLAGRGFDTPSQVQTLDWIKFIQPKLL